MPKCPKCGKEIDYLFDYSKVEQLFIFSLENGEPRYEAKDSFSLSLPDEWECPECGEVLFRSEEDAIKFLKGE